MHVGLCECVFECVHVTFAKILWSILSRGRSSLLLLKQGHEDAPSGFSVRAPMPGPYMQWAFFSFIIISGWPFSLIKATERHASGVHFPMTTMTSSTKS